MNTQLSTKQFDVNNFEQVKNDRYFSKPHGGFWTSTKKQNNKSEWVEWCETEMPHWLNGKTYEYEVVFGAKVLHVKNGIEKYILKDLNWLWGLDFESMMRDGYHGLHYNHDGDRKLFGIWDVESTIWFYPDVLTLVSK